MSFSRGLTALTLATGLSTPVGAQSEREMVQRYCAGMITEFYNPDGTRTDCISSTHAIEVDFSNRWADAIGQALHYALWTKEFQANPETFGRWVYQVRTARKPGMILICKANIRTETCADHMVRPKRIAEEYGIALTIWDCDPETDTTLAECQRIDVLPTRAD